MSVIDSELSNAINIVLASRKQAVKKKVSYYIVLNYY